MTASHAEIAETSANALTSSCPITKGKKVLASFSPADATDGEVGTGAGASSSSGWLRHFPQETLAATKIAASVSDEARTGL